ncbi:hypothetical protein OG21DRAFT_1517415 [Imleria badia]|nr:hypothetical protein OG21DRAFT_1517415 [Imleria badia]
MWMPNGTLIEYINQNGKIFSVSTRAQLIEGIATGLAYLHSIDIVHGDLHPGNILIDSEHNARLTDFGLSQALSPVESPLSYLQSKSIRPGAVLFAAPELLHPELYPDLKNKATLNSDVYSLGSIILFILSGKFPWNDGAEMESNLKEFKNPPRPVWPVIQDGVWDLLERCWSPRLPSKRSSVREVLSFSTDKREQLLQPSPASVFNVVLFGALGCGKSSIINLLADKPIARVSTDVDPCTKRPQRYEISIGERRFRLWDTMGFCLARRETSPLLPYNQAHALLRNLADGVNLILLCACKDEIFTPLGGLYRLINDFFYGGRAPIAFVVTQFDTPDEGWWPQHQDAIAQRTGIPVQSIPHACITTLQTGCVQSKEALKALLDNFAPAIAPVTLRPDLSLIATLRLAYHCRLSIPKAIALAKQCSRGRPPRPFNVVLFGETGVGKSSVINLLAGHQVARVSSALCNCTLNYCSYNIDTGMQQFLIWDTMGVNGMDIGNSMGRRAIEDAFGLLREVSRLGGVDLLVFCKRGGRITMSDQNTCSLFKEFLCQGQVPVAVVVTGLEHCDPMEKWWEEQGEHVVQLIGGGVIGHACITSLPFDSLGGGVHRVLESRLSLQAMLEDCVFSRSTPTGIEGILSILSIKRTGEMGHAPKTTTIRTLMDRCGFPKEQAEELLKLRSGSG